MRWDCTPLVYMVDDIEGKDASAEEKMLDTLLAEKWQREYSKMV